MITLTILDATTPIIECEAAPDIDAESGEDSGRFAPLVEFRVHRYELRSGYAALQSGLRAAGEAMLAIGGRRGPLTDEERAEAMKAIAAGGAVSDRLRLIQPDGTPVAGRVTLLAEAQFGSSWLVAIGLALPQEYVHPSAHDPRAA